MTVLILIENCFNHQVITAKQSGNKLLYELAKVGDELLFRTRQTHCKVGEDY